MSSIAAQFGLSTEALLEANGLDWSSVIYTGHTLVIPSGGASFSDRELLSRPGSRLRCAGNAAIIIQVGRELGVSDYGIVIALATAMQESTLRNLDWGDRDSVGLFQQRPSAGWGTVEQLTDPCARRPPVLRRREQPQPRQHARSARRLRLGVDAAHGRSAGRADLRLPRRVRQVGDVSAWTWLAELGLTTVHRTGPTHQRMRPVLQGRRTLHFER